MQVDIKSEEIAQALLERGFTCSAVSPEAWTMQSPETVSSTKAKKIVSTVIKLYSTAKEITRAEERYHKLWWELEGLG